MKPYTVYWGGLALVLALGSRAMAAEVVTPALYAPSSSYEYVCRICGNHTVSAMEICKDGNCSTLTLNNTNRHDLCEEAAVTASTSSYAFCRITFKGSKRKNTVRIHLRACAPGSPPCVASAFAWESEGLEGY